MISGLSVLVPWCDRPELSQTLTHNLPILRELTAEVFIINCGGQSQLLSDMIRTSTSSPVTQIDLPCVRFNKSLALNIGIHLSNRDTILVLDCDVLLNDQTLACRELAFDDCYVTVETMRETSPGPHPLQFLGATEESYIVEVDQVHSLQFKWSDGSTSEIKTARKSMIDGSRAGAGLLMAKRTHLANIGGYNSALEHWGWEDNDIQLRLKKLLHLRHVEHGGVEHLTHNDDVRAMHGEGRAELTFLNLKLSAAAFARRQFIGTLDQDVNDWGSRIISRTWPSDEQ